MRRRIQELARGQFRYDRPLVELSVDKLELHVLHGRTYSGEFVIKSANDVPVKGVIYTSSPRMECKKQEFEGTSVRIPYQFHSEGLDVGSIKKGKFYIISDGGEYDLSFVVFISSISEAGSAGGVKSLHDFVKLARNDYAEAIKVFGSENFKMLLEEGEDEIGLMYKGLRRQEDTALAVEEFLCGIHKKDPVTFTIRTENTEITADDEMHQELVIQKNTWGYTKIQVKSDVRWLKFSKTTVGHEDFIGSIYRLPYMIDKNELHAGKNMASIVCTSNKSRCELKIVVHKQGTDQDRIKEHIQGQRDQAKLLEEYVKYRLGRSVTGYWCESTVEILNKLQNNEKSWKYQLMKAHAYAINSQRQEAEWILDEFTLENRNNTDTILWAYSQYLSTFLNCDSDYVKNVSEQLIKLFVKLKEPVEIFWMLLFINDEYRHDPLRKYKDIIEMMKRGVSSPYIYVEALEILKKESYLLMSVSQVEKRIMLWAAKNNCLSEELTTQIIRLGLKENNFDRTIYKVLENVYENAPSQKLLEAICSYLIRFEMYGEKYFKWYRTAVDQGLRITNLYEAYVMSMDSKAVIELPRVIQLYFQYNNTLPFYRKALLYVNIIANKEKEPGIYQNYQQIIEDFALAQLKQRHIDDNLAVLYDNVLRRGVINKEISDRLADVLYTCRLTCLEDDIRYVILIQKKWQKNIVVPFVNNTAYVPIYTNDYAILLEDTQGRRMSAMGNCQLEKLMHPAHYIRRTIALSPEQIPYLLHYFESGGIEKAVANDNLEAYFELMNSEVISRRYRCQLISQLIRYCYENDEYELFDVEINSEDFRMFEQSTRIMAQEILIERGEYDKACSQLAVSGIEFIQEKRLLKLCTYMIEESGYKEDRYLLSICERVFKRSRYNDVMLNYLCRYYQGPTKRMSAIFRIVSRLGTDMADLEERLLTQMMFTGEFLENPIDIYNSYRSNGGAGVVRDAYLAYFSYNSFVKSGIVNEEFYKELFEAEQDRELIDVCRLAILKWLSAKQDPDDSEKQMMDKLLGTFVGEGLYFAFYKNFDRELLNKYNLLDKAYVEYRTRPDSEVYISYQLQSNTGGEYLREPMTDMFEGIYVKTMVLFFGDRVPYYIEEREDGMIDITSSNELQSNESIDENEEDRYSLLNAIAVSQTLEDNNTLEELMHKYGRRERVTQEIFKVL